LELKLLIGNDVLLYREKGLVEDIGVSNPVAIATAPPDPSSYARAEDYMADFEDVRRIADLSRVFEFEERAHAHYVHAENLARMGERIRRLVERMGSALGVEPRSYASLSEYLTLSAAVRNLSRCLRKLGEGKDIVFVESFKLLGGSSRAWVGWFPHQVRLRLPETRLVGGNRDRCRAFRAEIAQGVRQENCERRAVAPLPAPPSAGSSARYGLKMRALRISLPKSSCILPL